MVNVHVLLDLLVFLVKSNNVKTSVMVMVSVRMESANVTQDFQGKIVSKEKL